MTKETIFCDRCGKECEYHRKNPGFFMMRTTYHLFKSSDRDYVDLCQSCYDSLGRWMSEKK